MRIILDPGHGGDDPGAIGIDDAKEKELNLVYASMIAGHLAGFGVDPQMTRYTDETLSLQARCDIANDMNGRNLGFVSIHCNAYTTWKPRGWEVFTCRGPTEADDLAANVAAKMELVHIPSRGLKEKNFKVLTGTEMPAILIELGFITNPSDAEYLQNLTKMARYCNRIALGIASWRP